MVIINQKHTINSQKPKRKELKHTTKENNQTITGETKRRRNELKKKLQEQMENKE